MSDKPSHHVPHAHVSVTSTTDESVAPWDHGPDAHDMAMQGPLMVAIRIENMDLGVIKRHDNVFWRQMQACNHSLVRSDVMADGPAAMAPRRLDHVSLLEVRLVRYAGGTMSRWSRVWVSDAVKAVTAHVRGAAGRRRKRVVKLEKGPLPEGLGVRCRSKGCDRW